MPEDVEECPSCQVAVLGGTILEICNNETKGLDCKQLKEDFVAGKLSVRELIDKVRDNVNPKMKEQIKNIEEWAKSEGVDLSQRAPPE
jgi:hypothetical protein